MKEKLTFSLLALSSTLLADSIEQESPEESIHHISPKAFYRYHEETGYTYKTAGLGFQYYLNRPKGVNLKIDLNTNGKDKYVFVESETSLFFKVPYKENQFFYPLLSSKQISHKVAKYESEDHFVNKSTMYLGLGYQCEIDKGFILRGEVQGSRDIFNTLSIIEREYFWGKSFSNPFGYRVRVGGEFSIAENKYLDVHGFYAQSFKQCFKELGCELAFKWGF